MHFSPIISKVLLLFASLLITLKALFFSRMDTWPIDLFYFLPVFSLMIILDFMIYEINCESYKGREHIAFCTFPLSRWNIILLEFKYYFKRWEFVIFIASIFFYIIFFYFLSNSKILPVLLINTLFSLQTLYIISILFLTKNLFNLKNLNSDIKNFSSILITSIILIYSFAGTSKTIELIFYINPLSSGFLSYLLGLKYAILSFCIIFITIVFFYSVNRKIIEWPLS